MSDLLIILVAALVFGGAWWGLSKLGASPFVVAALSFFLAMLVFVSRSLFGVPLSVAPPLKGMGLSLAQPLWRMIHAIAETYGLLTKAL